jgi:UDP-glucose 4-epimerase
MKTLITGGGGFVGSEIIRKWQANTNGSIVVLEKNSEYLENLSFSKNKLELIHGDSSNLDLLNTIFSKNQIHRVIHLAANSDIKSGSSNTGPDFHDTLKTSVALAEILEFHRISNLYFASSSAVYGDTVGPILLNEPLIKSPISNYGWAKLASEKVLEGAAIKLGFTLKIIRFPNVVGPNPTHGILFDFKNKLKANSSELVVLGDGNQSKPFIHVNDLTDVILHLISMESNSDLKSFNEINIGPGDTITVKKIVDIVLEITGLNPNINWGSKPSGWEGDVPSYNYGDELPREFAEIEIRNSKDAVTDAFTEWWER